MDEEKEFDAYMRVIFKILGPMVIVLTFTAITILIRILLFGDI
jgi:hypothetical protein